VVIALGTGKRDDNGKVHPFEVKVGDRVLVGKYGGTEVKLDEQKYTLVREDDILGVIA
jgi:chaperonin GroES